MERKASTAALDPDVAPEAGPPSGGAYRATRLAAEIMGKGVRKQIGEEKR